MELKEFAEIVSKESGVTEDQAVMCIKIIFKKFAELPEDELTDLIEDSERKIVMGGKRK